jgi:hypothetical protein
MKASQSPSPEGERKAHWAGRAAQMRRMPAKAPKERPPGMARMNAARLRGQARSKWIRPRVREFGMAMGRL